MEDSKKYLKMAKVFFALSAVCVVLDLFIPVARYWKEEAETQEKASIRYVFACTSEYLDDSFEKGEIKTKVTCEDLVAAGYMLKTPKEAGIADNFEIKVNVIDGRPSVEYVKSKKFIYTGVGEFY